MKYPELFPSGDFELDPRVYLGERGEMMPLVLDLSSDLEMCLPM